jgi:hypothetical protein
MATTENEIEYVAIVRNGKALIGSWARVFAAAALAAFTGIVAARVADGEPHPFAIDFTVAQGILAAGLFAVAPVIRNWLTPSDPRYGLVPAPDADDASDDEDEQEQPATVTAASLSVETQIAEPLPPEETWYDDEDRGSRKSTRSRAGRSTAKPKPPTARTRIGFTA